MSRPKPGNVTRRAVGGTKGFKGEHPNPRKLGGNLVDQMRDIEADYQPGDFLYENPDDYAPQGSDWMQASGTGVEPANPAISMAHPTKAMDDFQFKHKVGVPIMQKAAAQSGQGRPYDVSLQDSDIQALHNMWKIAKQRDYFRWVLNTVDIRKPGMFQWLMEKEPDVLRLIMEQLDRDIRREKKKQVLSITGPQSKEDLRFMYADQIGAFASPETQPRGYISGFFSRAFRKDSGTSASFGGMDMSYDPFTAEVYQNAPFDEIFGGASKAGEGNGAIRANQRGWATNPF